MFENEIMKPAKRYWIMRVKGAIVTAASRFLKLAETSKDMLEEVLYRMIKISTKEISNFMAAYRKRETCRNEWYPDPLGSRSWNHRLRAQLLHLAIQQ
jgi:hypothetical protein